MYMGFVPAQTFDTMHTAELASRGLRWVASALHTLHLFTKSDYKTTVIPLVSAGQ